MRAVKSKLFSINKKAVKSVIAGAVTAVILAILFSLLTAFIITLIGKLPDDSAEYISLAIIGLGSLFGGYTAARIYKSSGLFIGISTGLLISLIILFAGINSLSNGFEIFGIFKILIIILFSIIGAIPGANKKEKYKYK